MKIGAISLGCDKNRVDTEKMLARLVAGGHTLVGSEDEADVLIVNTCAFIDKAKEESIDEILNALSAKSKSGGRQKVIVTGCLAGRYMDELKSEFDDVDAILGIADYDKILDTVNKITAGDKVYACFSDDKFYGERVLTTPYHYAYLKIADGCDNHCTYCAIPKIRGKYRSRTIESILKEAKWLEQKGIKELILVAQDTTYYGFDIYGKYALSDLLQQISKLNFKWIRFLYAYPEKITDEALGIAHEMVSGSGPLTPREIKCLIVIILMFVTWIASTWIPIFNTTVVALFGTCLFMCPGIEVITWQDYVEKGGWDGTFLVGGVGAMAEAALSTGAASWIISSTLGGAAGWSPVVVCLAVSALICVLHWLCPSGPAVAGLAVAPIIILAQTAGASPVALAIITAFWSGVTFLLPTDAVPMFTYGFHYYSITDMVKEGWVPSLVFIVFVAFAIPFMTGILGYA